MPPDDATADQMVSDEILALSILNALRRLGSHARDATGAAGSVTVQVNLVPSPGRNILIGRQQHELGKSRSGNVVSTSARAETSASLDDLADIGPALIASAARVLDELGHSFGIPEMGQFSGNGEIRRRYWADSKEVAQWADAHGIPMTDDLIAKA